MRKNAKIIMHVGSIGTVSYFFYLSAKGEIRSLKQLLSNKNAALKELKEVLVDVHRLAPHPPQAM
jgi:hypothetical protein